MQLLTMHELIYEIAELVSYDSYYVAPPLALES